MSTRPWIDDEDLWALVEQLLPPWPERSPGPRPVADRLCFQGILFVLHNDIACQLLTPELRFGSDQTCWRRLNRWQKAGLFDQPPSPAGGAADHADVEAKGDGDASKTIVTTRSTGKKDLPTRLGADIMIVTGQDDDLTRAVLAVTSDAGVSVALDHVAGDTFAACLSVTAHDGHVVNIGRLAGPATTIDLDALSYRHPTVHSVQQHVTCTRSPRKDSPSSSSWPSPPGPSSQSADPAGAARTVTSAATRRRPSTGR
ncbi:transposase [Streptomyces californicus]|uniref:transposase n=1 Tax=Streptomyces californicus TaxID=67351 RepID=UPI0036BBC3F0